MTLALNQLSVYRSPLASEDAACLDEAAALQVESLLQQCPAHRATPLHCLKHLARDIGVQSIHVKDESERLGLGSFKALGGTYAVIRVVLDHAQRALGRVVDAVELTTPQIRDIARTLTVCCATDGNHGRSVAAGARMIGARAVIFVHESVSSQRAAAIAAFGADVRRVNGNYDAAVAFASSEATANGWTLVSDTSWPGYEDVPRLVAQGYTAMVREACRELGAPPTHVFVQAGVGGLASAVAGHLSLVYADARPRVIVVEPERAACLYASHQAGRRIAITPREPTVMAMLECYEPSMVAWNVVSRIADAFMLVEEEGAIEAMRCLATPQGTDPPIVAGESGAAGMAGLLSVAGQARASTLIGLDRSSRVLLFNTEGATDPETYRELVGRTSDEVLSARGVSSK